MTDGPTERRRTPGWLHALGGCGIGFLLVARLIRMSDGGDALAWGFAVVGVVAVVVWGVAVVIMRRRMSG